MTNGFRALLEYQLDIGCDMDDAVVTLLALARAIPMARVDYGSFDDLADVAALVLDWAKPDR